MSIVIDIFKKNRHLIFFILILIIGFWLLFALRNAILPFIFGLALAYILLPIISWAEARLPRRGKWLKTKRTILVILSLIVILGVAGVFSFYIFNAVFKALLVIFSSAPEFISWSIYRLQEWAGVLRQQFPPEMQQQIDKFILDAGAAVGNAIRNAALRGFTFAPSTFSLILGFCALPIFLFYTLRDSEKLSKSFYSALPSWTAEHARNLVSIVERILGRYIRAQLMLGFIVAYFTFIGLVVLKIDYAPALAAFAGITELIPIIGPWIGGAAAVIVTLAIAPDKAIWVAVLFLVIQLLENNLLVPRIQGAYLRIHPAIAIVLLVLGGYIAGFWGLILAIPLTATIVELYKYVRQTMIVEEIQ